MAARHDLIACAASARKNANLVIDAMEQKHLSLTAACKALNVSCASVRRAISQDAELRVRVAHARLSNAEHYLDETITIADEPPCIDKYGRVDSGAVRDKAVRLQARQFAYCKMQTAIDGARTAGIDLSLGERSQPVSRVIINIVGSKGPADNRHDETSNHLSNMGLTTRPTGGETTHHDLGHIIDANAVSVWREKNQQDPDETEYP